MALASERSILWWDSSESKEVDFIGFARLATDSVSQESSRDAPSLLSCPIIGDVILIRGRLAVDVTGNVFAAPGATFARLVCPGISATGSSCPTHSNLRGDSIPEATVFIPDRNLGDLMPALKEDASDSVIPNSPDLSIRRIVGDAPSGSSYDLPRGC